MSFYDSNESNLILNNEIMNLKKFRLHENETNLRGLNKFNSTLCAVVNFNFF